MKVLILILLATALSASAQEIVVEATSLSEDKIEPSRSATVINEVQIRNQHVHTVVDLFEEIAGVEVVRQGGVGQTTSVFIRGARSEDTLVLIDGAEVNDAMSPACGFDFSFLSPENIERIEVYRGPQSVRFGAGALGGVINIITKEGKGKPVTSYSADAGTYQTEKLALGNSGQFHAVGYSASVDQFYTRGFSAAAKQDGNNEPDGAAVKSVSSKIDWLPNTISKIEGTIRYIQADVDIDAHGGQGGDDPNDSSYAKQLVAGVSASRRFLEERLKSTFGYFYSEFDRGDQNLPDAVSTIDSSDHFLSETQKIQSDNDLLLGDFYTLRVGLQWRQESGRSTSLYNGASSNVARHEQSVAGESATILFDNRIWFFDVGARSDQSTAAGAVPDDRISVGRHIGDGRAFVTYGTGFKLPSLYELYSSYGDSSLRSETSNAFEATIEQKPIKDLLVSLTAYRNTYRDLIDFDTAGSRYFNISRAKSFGVEVQATYQVLPQFKMHGSYAYLDARDESTGLLLLRRPENSWSLSAKYSIRNFDGLLLAQFRGERYDSDPDTYQKITDSSYTVYNANFDYRFSNELKLNARVDNILNAQYEDVAGYGTPGRSFYLGVTGEI